MSPTAPSAWQTCLDRLEHELEPDDFMTWIKPLRARIKDDALLLSAPNQHVVEAVRVNYLPQITELVEHFMPGLAVYVEQIALEPKTVAPSSHNEPMPSSTPSIDGRYRFDNFVEGNSNQLARAAAMEVSQSPGVRYNPLLLYGSTGLGKTHLMLAAGYAMRQAKSGARVIYMRSDQFFNQMVKALQNKQMDQFKAQFKHADALLIDDIQFFAGKDRTQEEFFHTFNVFFDAKLQIILTCDRFPKEVDRLEPRLKSRLGWGLSVAIEPPDFETRAAILMTKADERGMTLPDEVAILIAKRMRSNVRDLEGALNTLSARASFTGQPITIDFAQETLRDMLRAQAQALSIDRIQKITAEYFDIRLSDMLSRKRTRNIVRPRQIAMALCKELTTHSLPEIGQAFGGRDHTTVIHACKVVQELRATDGQVNEDYERLIRQLNLS